MPEISHQKIATYLNNPKTIKSVSIYLFHGEEYLYKRAIGQVLDILLPGSLREHNCITIDGGNGAIAGALAELDTFSLMGDSKVVMINDAKIFNDVQNKTALVDKVQIALADEKYRSAAQFFLSFLSSAGHTVDDVYMKMQGSGTVSLLAPFSDQDAIKKLIHYCREKKMKPVDQQDGGDALQRLIEKGIVDNHYLIIAVDTVDRRRKLFKVIKDNGLVVDCTVPKGDRRADRQTQNVVLKEALNTILAPCGKSIQPAAYQTLCEMTGFDLRLFSQNLEKLVDYAGERPRIETKDVLAVVERSRQDPIYAFTNAILDRNEKEALFLLDALLRQEMHPLQMLTAMVNQFRRLMLAKDFVLSAKGKCWVKGSSYRYFTTNVMAAVEEYDQKIIAAVYEWYDRINLRPDHQEVNAKKKKKRQRKNVATDLRLVKNKNSPYPVYQLILRTDSFSRNEILAFLETLSRADYKLKTSSQSPRLILENAILFLCNPSLQSMR